MNQWKIPAVTAGQMREIDDAAISNGLFVMQMMEHAALQAARLLEKQYPNAKSVLIICGPGNNGADGIATARIVANWGYDVSILLSHPEAKLSEMASHHLALAQKMGLSIQVASDADSQAKLKQADIHIDALLGYSLQGDIREPIATLIKLINASPKPVLSIDTPSGLDVTSGKPSSLCIRADETMTLGLPKTGLFEKSAKEYVGRLFLADLTIPHFLFQQFDLTVPENLFKESSLIEL